MATKTHFIPLFATLLVLASFINTPAFAQSLPESTTVVAISTHTVIPSQQPVYSLLDLQGLPALKIVSGIQKPQSLRMELHGLQLKTPSPHAYQVTALFEDASGAPLGKSQPLAYKSITAETPFWFKGLEGVVGMSGVMPIEVPVPPETHIVTLVVSDPAGGAYPHMAGVVSNVELVGTP